MLQRAVRFPAFVKPIVVSLLAVLPTLGDDRALDARYLDGLRARRLYELAERYCSDRLADEAVTQAHRAELTIELARTLAEHALHTSPESARPLWHRAEAVIDEFASRHADSPRLPLVRLQGLLVSAARGEAAREAAQDADNSQALDEARGILRRVIAGFERLDADLESAVRRQGRASSANSESAVELQSLQRNVRLELAKALRQQAMSYPQGSADRINALTRAGEALAAVMHGGQPGPLYWAAELEEVARQRMLGEYSQAERRLAALDKSPMPADVAALARAERIRLALARRRVDDALAEAGIAGSPRSAAGDFARLEAMMAAWQRAVERRQSDEVAQWQQRSVELAQQIGREYGGRWLRRAEALVARELASSKEATPASLSLAAAGYYRGGELDKAREAFDQAARQARDARQPEAAFEAAYSAATIEKERGNFPQALERYRRLAMDHHEHPRAAAVHLLAVHCAAQAAQASQPPRTEEYERLLAEHLQRWPSGPTAAQALSWLGRLELHRRQWPRAIATLSKVRPGDPQYAEAVAAICQAYEGWLAATRSRGESTQRLADDALASFERLAQQAAQRGNGEAAATANLAAARVWLLEMPGGALTAERLLNPLAEQPELAQPVLDEAQRWLIAALALQGKGARADALVGELATRPDEQVALVDLLAEVRARQSDDAARRLAELESRLQNRLLERPGELDGAALRGVLRRQALLKIETGERRAGLEQLQEIAQQYPRDGQAQEDLARALASGGAADVRAAVTAWQQVVRKSRPGTARWFRAQFGLAEAEWRSGDEAAARQTLQAAAERLPTDDNSPLSDEYARVQKILAGR